MQAFAAFVEATLVPEAQFAVGLVTQPDPPFVPRARRCETAGDLNSHSAAVSVAYFANPELAVFFSTAVFPGIYAKLKPVFFPQAIAQDIASLTIVSPLWIILSILALRGSIRAYLVWLGVLTFTVYDYVIYTFSVPFGPLFLLWVTVLGLSLYALIGGVASINHESVKASFKSRRATTFIAWFPIVVAILFSLLWLSEDVPALLSGTTPQSLVDMAIPTNPVHILDWDSFYLR